MGSPVQPLTVDQIQDNVNALKSQGASDADVEAYLKNEGYVPSGAPVRDNSVSLRNLGRAALQGATFNWADEALGKLPASLGGGSEAEHDFRGNAAVFQHAHPALNFGAEFAGGLAAPVAATLLAPEAVGGLGGAAAMGGLTTAASAAGASDGSVGDRLKAAAIGGPLGVFGGIGGYAGAKVIGSGIGKILDLVHPERAVQRGASEALGSDAAAVASRMNEVNKIAPGGASIATASAPKTGLPTSRLLPFLRGVGASPEGAQLAEQNFLQQGAALKATQRALGDKMDALAGQIPVDPDVKAAMQGAADILGSKAPTIPKGQNPTVEIQDLRDALSRLRYAARQAAKRGTDANGPSLHDINVARDQVQRVLYDRAPGFASLDRDYSTTANAMRQVEQAVKTVQRSRANYAANGAYGATSGSLGGSLPSGTHGLAMTMLDKLFTNKAGAADATARLLTTSGDGQLIASLLARQAPGVATRVGRKAAAPLTASAIPAIRSLLFPADTTQ